MLATQKNAILLSKYPQQWSQLFIDTLSHKFTVEVVYANDIIAEHGTKYLISVVNQLAADTNSDIIFIEVDFYPAIDGAFIRQIKIEKKITFTFDDLIFHERNVLTAAAGGCDLVLTADPLSVLKYEEKMINSHLAFHDTTLPEIKKSDNDIKTHDVLFFGSTEIGGRKIFIDYLISNGVEVKVVQGVSREELVTAIRTSKIILNLSKTFDTRELKSFGYSFFSPFSAFLQFKLRVLEAGLIGTACVSEYTPSTELMFSKDEVPTFKTKEECLDIIQQLLANEELLKRFALNLNRTALEKYESKPLVASILGKIEDSHYTDIHVEIPVWYYVDTLKHRINIVSGRSLKKAFNEFRFFSYPTTRKFSIVNSIVLLKGITHFIGIALSSFRTSLSSLFRILSKESNSNEKS